VVEIYENVKKATTDLFQDKKLIIETCGSFRRGKPSCGDVDILITTEDEHDDIRQVKGMLEKVVSKLEEEGFLKERLG